MTKLLLTAEDQLNALIQYNKLLALPVIEDYYWEWMFSFITAHKYTPVPALEYTDMYYVNELHTYSWRDDHEDQYLQVTGFYPVHFSVCPVQLPKIFVNCKPVWPAKSSIDNSFSIRTVH